MRRAWCGRPGVVTWVEPTSWWEFERFVTDRSGPLPRAARRWPRLQATEHPAAYARQILINMARGAPRYWEDLPEAGPDEDAPGSERQLLASLRASVGPGCRRPGWGFTVIQVDQRHARGWRPGIDSSTLGLVCKRCTVTDR
jgi:hypothetical protein